MTCTTGHRWLPHPGHGMVGWVFCLDCNTETKAPAPAAAPAPRGAADSRPAAVPAPAGLTAQDVGYLRIAARWGLLRQLGGMRLLLTGEFSLPFGDMVELARAAGAVVSSGASIADGTVDAVVYGEAANAVTLQLAVDWQLWTWSEAELVGMMTPSLDQLEPAPGQPTSSA